MKKNKSQISIFIIVAMMIIILVTFLTFQSLNFQTNNLEESRSSVNTVPTDLAGVKSQIDFCMDRNLKRALIVSGVKGGFIYDEGEYYGPSVIPRNTYSSNFITNMNLNWNNLLFNTLVIVQTQVYMPSINNPISFGDQVIYSRGISDDIKRFITEEFFNCVDFSSLEERGFVIDYERFSGTVNSIDVSTGYISINDLRGKVGDNVLISFDEKSVIGEIENFRDNLAIVKFDIEDLSGVTTQRDLSSLFAINTDSLFNLELVFTDNSVILNSNFPITVSFGNRKISIDDLQATANIRYRKILDLVSVLATQKYQDRTLDYSNEEDILRVLNRFYDSNTDIFRNIEVRKTIVNDTDINKRFIYSIVDYDSRISGNPFVFNFGYENDAPEIDISSFAIDLFEDQEVLIFTSPNNLVELDLKQFTSDRQIIDNFRSYFISQEYNGDDAFLSLSREGILKFEGFENKRFNFNIEVTDGEAINSKEFVFLTGLPDNKDNRLASSCIKFENYGVEGYFPISNDFRNKHFTYVENNRHHVYGYSLYLGPGLQQEFGLLGPQLYFSQTCIYNTNLFEAIVTMKNKETQQITPLNINLDSGLIQLPMINSPIEIKIEVRNKLSRSLATEEYIFEIYPASCLGPDPITDPSQVSLFGGTQSCCNTQPIKDSILNNQPRSFVNTNSNLINSGSSINAEAYFCYDITATYDPSIGSLYSGHHTINNIWQKFGNDITSLYEGRINLVCDGTSAVGKLYGVESSSNSLFGITSKVGYDRSIIDSQIPYSLSKVQDAGTCSFCFIENKVPFVLQDSNNLIFFSGLKALNPQPSSAGVRPLPYMDGIRDLSNIHVMCDANWYRSDNANYNQNSWNLDYTGKGGVPSPIFISQGYCYQGSTVCSGRPNSPTFLARFDNQPICVDWYYESNGNFLNQPNTGWVCGTDKICNDGVCE